MEKNDQIKFDALKQMRNKYLRTFTFNTMTSSLYDSFDDEEAVKNELIQMDAKHNGDINAILSANAYDDITARSLSGKRKVLSRKGNQDLASLTKQDEADIRKNSAQ